MTTLLLTAAVSGVDPEARTISGLVVPFGKAGQTSGGRLTFSAGALQISEPRRVKLLREHDQRDAVGYATDLVETDAGLVGTFHVPEGDNGDRALAEASNGLRDAFSVGVQLDDSTATKLRRSQGAPVAGAGQLREVSLVSVPAFDDARVAAAAGADLVVSSWGAPETTTTETTTAGTAGTTTTTERNTMDPETTTEGAGGTTTASTETTTASTSTTGTAASTTTAAAPAVVPAVAGAAHVTGVPATYSFDAGNSLVRDLFDSAMRGDGEARERVERFNAELRDQNPASVHAFVTAAATRDNIDGAGTDLPSFFQPGPNRPDLMRALVDVKRPFISRLDRIPISNAQPFAIPKVGEFTGVGPHTEGTPHRPAGTLTLGGDTVQPTATSGAWEVSRELLDAATPALDRIAARAMLRDYQRQTEGKIIDLMAAVAVADTSNVYSINTPMALRGAMLDFVNEDEEAADLVVVSKSLLRTLALDTDTTDRPQLPYVTPVNATGTVRAGYTGVAIDGVEVVRSVRLDAGVGAGTGVLARSQGILWAESNVLQFRFDEVLGPGVVKLALWAYSGAAILDTADVAILNAGADPTP